ncbi:UBX domain-containing protein 7 [Aplysia californica]|uniref:UBX domain-containing protein 7 n=1 Tax=Aplysia californica TaxID=6500 RepID=A0ABM0JRD7_APLCA|nr:UBX domain-containing protein 7 [Aplysia californica]
MATSSGVSPELIDQFVAVTGAGRSVAVSLLEACSGNLDLAVGMHMDSGGGAGAGPSNTHTDMSGPSGAAESADDAVRAPIPQRTEVLVEEDSTKIAWRMKRPRRHAASVFDGFRDFQSEAYHEDLTRGKRPSKKRNLEDLFRPPVDITHKGTFQNARDTGSAQNKWLLVNVQNVQEFPCQVLNRDVWSSQDVRNVLKDSFVFWQVYNDSEEGKRFMQFYKLKEWPYVAIIDPFTGESQVEWHKIADGPVFCDLAKSFLSTCPVPDASQVPNAAKRQKREPSIVDATEQEQMEAAIKASLSENQTTPSSPQYVLDSDSEADVVEDSDGVETFSDTEEVIVTSTPPGPSSNGVHHPASPEPGRSASTSSSSPSKAPSISNGARLKKHPPTSSSSSSLKHLSSSSTASSSSPSSSPWVAGNNNSTVSPRSNSINSLSRLSASANNSEFRISHRDLLEAGSSSGVGTNPAAAVLASVDNVEIWAGVSQPGRDSPLEVNLENTLIDMIGGREAEVCTPDICTPEVVDSSSSNSQCSLPEADAAAGQNDVVSGEDWKDHWGDTSDPMSRLMLRFPENKREQVELPCSSSLKALVVLCTSKGFPPDKYELVTTFPRRKLSQLGSSTTLQEAGLHQQETIFVQDL